MPRVILTATTDAANSEPVICGEPNRPVCFTCPGIGAGESATLQRQNADGTWTTWTYDTVGDGSGTSVTPTITSVNMGITLDVPGIFRIAKGATVGAVGVEVSTHYAP